MRLLRMVEVRDLKPGDVLVTNPYDGYVVVSTRDEGWKDGPFWWEDSTLYIKAMQTKSATEREVAVRVVDGDEHTKIGVWR